jgi:alpha-glucosidase
LQLSVFHQKAWTWSDERKKYYLHQFAKEQPDLNYRNPLVEIEMRKVILHWLAKGADGFRIDAINHSFEVSDFADEPLKDPLGDPNSYANLDHRYTMDLQETYNMVHGWRQMMDAYTASTDNVTRLVLQK